MKNWLNNQLLKLYFFKLKNEVESKIRLVNTKENSHLQNYLYFACYPLFNYVEAAIILCGKGKTRALESILRSLIELHINVIYYQVAESEYRLALSVKNQFDEKVKGLQEIRRLIQKYENLKSNDPKNLFNDEWLINAESWAIEYRKAILRGNNLKEDTKELGLKDKAIKCDQANLDDVEPGHFERMYHLIYRQLSPSTHLNMAGLQGFVEQKDTGEYVFRDGDKGYFLMQQAVEVCVVLTKDLYENSVIEGKIPKVVGKIEKLLKG